MGACLSKRESPKSKGLFLGDTPIRRKSRKRIIRKETLVIDLKEESSKAIRPKSRKMVKPRFFVQNNVKLNPKPIQDLYR